MFHSRPEARIAHGLVRAVAAWAARLRGSRAGQAVSLSRTRGLFVPAGGGHLSTRTSLNVPRLSTYRNLASGLGKSSPTT